MDAIESLPSVKPKICEGMEYEKDLNELKEQILEEGDSLVSKRDLLERFVKIDNYYNNRPWNLLQILANINILIGEEPCTDAISRQAAYEIVDNMLMGERNHKSKALDEIKCLPPVMPAQNKTGKWKWQQYNNSLDLGNWYCSECGSIAIECVPKQTPGGVPLFKYCPYCGIKINKLESEEEE